MPQVSSNKEETNKHRNYQTEPAAAKNICNQKPNNQLRRNHEELTQRLNHKSHNTRPASNFHPNATDVPGHVCLPGKLSKPAATKCIDNNQGKH